MASKYKVELDGNFLGHYYATDPIGAIKKAIDDNESYIGGKIYAENATFSAQKGVLNPKFNFSWNELPFERKAM